MQLQFYLYFLQQYSSRNEVSIIARRQWNYFIFRNTAHFSLAAEIHAKIFCWHFNCTKLHCTIPILNCIKSLMRTPMQGPLHRSPVFFHIIFYFDSWRTCKFCVTYLLTYLHVLTYFLTYLLLPCFISGHALEARRLCDVGLSFAHDTRVLRMNIRSLASPSVFGFALDTWALWIPRLWVWPNIASCTDYQALIYDFAFDIRALCILGSAWFPSQIESLASPLILGRLHPLLWLHPWIASHTDYQAPIPGRQWHIRGGEFGHAPFVQKKISHGHKNNRKTWLAHFFVKALVARHEMAHAAPHEILNTPLPGALHPRLWLRPRIASCTDYHTFGSGFNFFIFHYIEFDCQLKCCISMEVREQHHKSTTGPWFKKV